MNSENDCVVGFAGPLQDNTHNDGQKDQDSGNNKIGCYAHFQEGFGV
jgi:hypothetical protein